MSALSPCRTVVTSFSTGSTTTNASNDEMYERGVWVLALEACPTAKWLSCALSDGTILVYDQERLHIAQTYPKAHGDAMITDLSFGGPTLLASAGQDGSICLLDLRQPTPAGGFSLARKEQALSVALGYDGALAAVGGSKAHISFHDLRNAGTVLGSYQDAHTEEVTRVRFQPQDDSASHTTPLLLSASEDGLACIFDTSQPSEEAALRSVLNVQTPLRQVGFFGPSYEGVYCLTGSETMSVWHHDSAQRICDYGVDVREKLARLAGGMDVDYLVDCRWDRRCQHLSLLAGNHSGSSALFQVNAGQLSLSYTMSGGHRGDVRAWCPLNSNIFVTAGEDARICEWSRMGQANRFAGQASAVRQKAITNSGKTATGPVRGGGPLRRTKRAPSGVAPY